MRIAQRVQAAILRRDPRLAEGWMSAVTIGVGLVLASKGIFATSITYWAAAQFLPEAGWAIAFLAVGTVKVLAAVIGSRRLRLAAIMAAMAVWGAWLALVWLGTGGPALGTVISIALLAANGSHYLRLLWTHDDRVDGR